MDRFRFRVWVIQEKKYIYDAESTWDDIEACFGDFIDNPKYIVEQCTGLKDKNGKLIYEGDTLFDGEFCGVVIWKESSWQVRFVLYDGDYGYEMLDQHFAEFGQVYNNIHE